MGEGRKSCCTADHTVLLLLHGKPTLLLLPHISARALTETNANAWLVMSSCLTNIGLWLQNRPSPAFASCCFCCPPPHPLLLLLPPFPLLLFLLLELRRGNRPFLPACTHYITLHITCSRVTNTPQKNYNLHTNTPPPHSLPAQTGMHYNPLLLPPPCPPSLTSCTWMGMLKKCRILYMAPAV
jgi:hypothetical protein